MKKDDWLTSDTMRALAKLLPIDDPNNPINLARAAEAEERRAAAAAAQAQQAAKLPAAPAPPAVAESAPPPAKKRRKRRRTRRPIPRVDRNETSLERHQRLCTICNHEDREAIDEDFLNWCHPYTISRDFEVESRAVYRHARATGLFVARERNLRAALGQIVERAYAVTPTIDGVLRAIRAYSCLDRDGHWTDPPAHVVVSSGSQLTQGRTLAPPSATIDLPAPDASESEEKAPVLIDNESE